MVTLHDETTLGASGYRSILEALEEGVVVQDATGEFVTWNAAAELLLGLEALALLEAAIGDVGEGDDDGGVRELGEADERGRDGEPAQLAVRPVHADDHAALLPARAERDHGRQLLTGQWRAVLADRPPPAVHGAAAGHPVGGEAEDALGRGVPDHELAGGVLHHDALLEGLEDRAVARGAEGGFVEWRHAWVVGRTTARLERGPDVEPTSRRGSRRRGSSWSRRGHRTR